MNHAYKKFKSMRRLRNKGLVLICFAVLSCTDKIIQLELSEGADFRKKAIVRLKLPDKLKTQPFQLIGKNPKGNFEIPYQIEADYVYWINGFEPSQLLPYNENTLLSRKYKNG